MQYEQHDFVSNVAALHKTGQEDKARQMLMKEIAQIIVYHRGHAIQALNQVGVKTNKFATDKELTDKLAENLGTNPKLQGIIAGLLVQLNQSPQRPASQGGGQHFDPFQREKASAQYSRAEGQGAGAGMGAGPVGAIASMIGNIFGFAKSKTDQKSQAEANKMQLAQALLGSQPQKNNAGLYVGIAIGVVAIGTIFYLAFGKKSAQPAPLPTM
jgi:hypothetical protein